MQAHARLSPMLTKLNEVELFGRTQAELITRYSVDEKLASEMAWDLIEVLTAIDGNVDIFEKYFLH